jgi:NADH:ubiquinone oxidoreductase subunit 4 (subunit M)
MDFQPQHHYHVGIDGISLGWSSSLLLTPLCVLIVEIHSRSGEEFFILLLILGRR